MDVPGIFGRLDIYVFDQLQRGRIGPGMRILDAGCGDGRNIEYFMRAGGYEVQGADLSADAIGRVRALAERLAPAIPATSFRQEPVEAMSFPDASVDVVISSAVLHFARDREHFRQMLLGSWRPLRTGGLFICRLASAVGVEPAPRSVGDGRYQLPDGTERFLVDPALLAGHSAELGGELVDPVRTTVVHGQRAMTTWVMRRRVD